MVDTTAIFPELSDDEGGIDFFNTFSAVWVVLYLAFLMVFSASPPFELSPIIAAAVFLPLAVIGIGIPLLAQSRYGNIFTSHTTRYQSAAVYALPLIGFLALGGGLSLGGSGGSFSVLQSGNDFYTAFIGNLAPATKAVFLVNVAPIAETILGFSGIYLLAGTLLKTGLRERIPGGGWTISFLVATPVAIGFGLIHDTEAARLTLDFFIRAFIVMWAPMAVIYGEILTDSDFLPFPAVMALAVSVHKALNLLEYGGLGVYFNDLLSAGGPKFLLSLMWVGYDALMVGLVAFGLGQFLVTLVSPNRNAGKALKELLLPNV